MNILIGILMYPPDFTGAGLRIHRLYSNLMKKGIDKVYVITNSINGFEHRIRMYDGLEINYIGHNKYAGKQIHPLKKVLKVLFVFRMFFKTIILFLKMQSKVDIIHTIDSSWLSSLIGWCAFLVKKPLIKEIVSLGMDDPLTLRGSKLPMFRSFFLFPFRYAKLIIVISPPLKNACIQYGLPEEKIWCRFNPVYLNNVNEMEDKNMDDENSVLKQLDFSACRILWVGLIIRRKNLEFLLNSALHLKGNVQVIVVGPHPDEKYFREISILSERIVRKTNNRIKVLFLGRIDNRKELVSLYKNSHLFWFASHNEGLGNVVIESLLCGTPVITLPVNNIMGYLIQNPEDGEVVNTNNPEHFAEVVNKCLYKNVYDRDMIAQRARKRFNNDQIENEYVSKFHEIARCNGSLC
ncbi:MAG: glycosyltransferase [wastewater metagenome]|nr:glycosyltransferase [Candidatus Loosdrechtia aerotolerans]